MGALSDIKVIDLTRVLSGPYCSMMLADMGADVIKIESPMGGDDSRAFIPFRETEQGRESLYFANLNRNKRGITLNLKTEKGKEIFRELIKDADVVIENFRPGVMDRLGLGYKELKKINHRLVYAAISGFGSWGPYSDRAGYDILAQAMGGLMSITGQPGDPPTRTGSAIGDVLGGMNAVIGILAALHSRSVTGEGQNVDIALVDSVVAATENTASRFLESGREQGRIGNRYPPTCPFDSFATKDGMIIIACGNQKLFEILCNEVLQMPELISDKRFVNMAERVIHQAELKVIIEEFLSDKYEKEIVDKLLSKGIPAGSILNFAQIVKDPHIVGARQMFVHLNHPKIGDIIVSGNPIKLMGTPVEINRPAPMLGQHNVDVLSKLGFDEKELESLSKDGVI